MKKFFDFPYLKSFRTFTRQSSVNFILFAEYNDYDEYIVSAHEDHDSETRVEYK